MGFKKRVSFVLILSFLIVGTWKFFDYLGPPHPIGYSYCYYNETNNVVCDPQPPGWFYSQVG